MLPEERGKLYFCYFARLLPWLHTEQVLLLAVPPLVTGEDGKNGDVQSLSLAHAQRFTGKMSL